MLNELRIKGLKPKENRYEILDGNGLYVRVYPSGRKSFYFRAMVNNKMHQEQFEDVGEISLFEARMKACKILASLNIEKINAARTLQDVYEEWKVEKEKTVKRFDKIKTLMQYVLKPLGNTPIVDIDDNALKSALAPLEDTDRIDTLHRVIFKLNEVMKFAYSCGYIDRIKTLYAVNRFKKKRPTEHRAWIDPDDLNLLFEKMLDINPLTKNYLKFCILSMLRPNENAGLQWEWVDLDKRLITIPGDHMKMGKDHIIPMSSGMWRILSGMKMLNLTEKYVWPAPNGWKSDHINVNTFVEWLKKSKLRGICTAHGLRATARTWLARNQVPESVAEACLAHSKGSAVKEAYNHEQFIEDRRKIMENWCKFVESKELEVINKIYEKVKVHE